MTQTQLAHDPEQRLIVHAAIDCVHTTHVPPTTRASRADKCDPGCIWYAWLRKRMKHIMPAHLAKPISPVCRAYCGSFRGVNSPMYGIQDLNTNAQTQYGGHISHPRTLPNMNAPSISFIRNFGEFLTTNQLLWQDAEARPCLLYTSPSPRDS